MDIEVEAASLTSVAAIVGDQGYQESAVYFAWQDSVSNEQTTSWLLVNTTGRNAKWLVVEAWEQMYCL